MIRQAFVLGTAGLAITGLVLGIDFATYAATGDSLVLGQLNKAAKSTTLQNTGNGPALKLVTKPTAPPFAVTSTKRIAKLNADKLDGWDAAKLSNDSYVFTDTDTSTNLGDIEVWDLPQLPKGAYAVGLNAVLAMSVGSAAAPNTAACYLQGPTGIFAASSATYTAGIVPHLSGADVVEIQSIDNWHIVCRTGTGNFRLLLPLRLTLTKTNLVQNGSL